MTLNASGAISLAGSTSGQSIALELSQSATGQISFNDTAVRALAGVPSGQISMPTNFYGKTYYAGQTITYSLGSGGSGGQDATNGQVGNSTTATFGAITLTAGGGERGYYNSSTNSGGGSASGGSSNQVGGAGRGAGGDQGGGGGGGINLSNAAAQQSGGYGGVGASAIDFNGLSAALSGTGYSLGSGGSGASNSSASPNAMNGGAGTGIGDGGGGAGWYGGNGGNGGYGGGGGGAAGYTAVNMFGGNGGQGIVVIRSYNGATYTTSVRISGTSYTLPSDTTSFEVWAIGGGGGGGGATNIDGSSSGGGGAGGICYRAWT